MVLNHVPHPAPALIADSFLYYLPNLYTMRSLLDSSDTDRLQLVLLFMTALIIAGCIHDAPDNGGDAADRGTSPTDLEDIMLMESDIEGEYTIQYADPIPEPQWSHLTDEHDVERGFMFDLAREDGTKNVVNIVARVPPENVGDVTIEDISGDRMDRPIDVDETAFDDDVQNIDMYEADGLLGERGYAITFTKKDIFVLIALDGDGVTSDDVTSLAHTTLERIE